MKILVANIGSTSFKFRLFEMAGASERELAAGGADRIGQDAGTLSWQVAGGKPQSRPSDFADHGEAVTQVLEQLVADGALAAPGDLDAVAFKAVMGGDLDPVVRVDEHVLKRMEYFVPIAPMHNPAYIAAMRMFRQVLGDTPLVAAFEPGFHHTIPLRRQRYAVPPEWAERYGVRRYGYHGASHCYIATRTAELMGADKARRIISCHLGGADAIVFTGGIGQKDPYVRAAVCSGLEFCHIAIDERKNEAAAGECRIESADSSSAVWVMPTNEELIVARQAAELLANGS